MDAFAPLDFFILGITGLGVWRGLRTGAMSQLVGTVGLVLAFLVGAALMGPVGGLVVASLGLSERIVPLVGFVVAFAAVLVAVSVVANAGKATLQALRLGVLDRAAGALFGGLRAALSLSVLFLLTSNLALPGAETFVVGADTRATSVLYAPVEALAPVAWEAFCTITPGVQDQLREKFDGLAGGAVAG